MRRSAYPPPPALTGERLLRLLADQTRLRLLALLGRTRELCVCELVAVIRLPQYTISRHLGPLRRAGLLSARREGPFVFYALAASVRHHPAVGPLLRHAVRLTGGDVLAQDLGRLRRLMRLETTVGAPACEGPRTPRLLRQRPILKLLSARNGRA